MRLPRILSAVLAALLAAALMPALALGASPSSPAKVKVGCFPLNGFCNVSDQGELSGYGIEYTDQVAKLANWDVEYVTYHSWVEALAALEGNQIDLLAPAQHTAERDAQFGFDAFPIGTEYGALLTLGTNDKLAYEDYAAFDGLKAGVVQSLVFLDEFEAYQQLNGFAVSLSYYKDTPALVAALNAGEVDAIVANSMVRTSTMKQVATFGAAPYYYMVAPGSSSLQEPLNQAIDKLSTQYPGYQAELSQKYFDSKASAMLSKEELDYVASVGTVKVAFPSSYAPLSYLDEQGSVDGVDRALFQHMGEFSGLSFECVAVPEGTDIIAYALENGIPLVANVEKDARTLSLSGLSVSNAMMDITKVFVGKAGGTFDDTAQATVAVTITSDELIAAWQQRYPSFTFVQYPSAADCIQAVHEGRASFALHNRYAMEEQLAHPANQDLAVMLTPGVSVEVCCGFTTDDALLASIINRSVAQITTQDAETHLTEYAQKTQYEYTLADMAYQYRVPLAVIVMAVVVAFAALAMLARTRRLAQQAIGKNERKLVHITNNINGGVVVLRADEGVAITFANDGFLEMIGITRAEFEASDEGSYLAYVHPDDLPKIREAIASDKGELSLDLRVLRKDGRYIPALFNCTVDDDAAGERQLYCVIMDMTQRNQLLDKLRIENARTELILDRVQEIFYEVDLRACSIVTSSSFGEKFGWDLPSSWVAGQVPDLAAMWKLHPDDRDKLKVAVRTMLDTRKPATTVLRLESLETGDYRWCETSQFPILADDGSIATIIGLINDIDQEVREREALREQAQRDALTGLYNKEAFEQQVRLLLEQQPGKNHALIFIDLDHFKQVNDTLGHLVGDRAICDAAAKLRIIFSHYDVMSRFGGDEFCVFVRNIPTATLCGKLDWLVDKLKETYEGPGGRVSVTCSCGVALTESEGFDYAVLIESADKALYWSKGHGRDQYTLFGSMKG